MEKITKSILYSRIVGAFVTLLLLTGIQSTSIAQVTTVLIPYTGSTSIPCGQNSLVQAHNGSVGTYSNNANGYVVVNAGFAAVISIVGTYTTESGFDYVRIYNGVGTGGTLLGTYNGSGAFTFNGTAGQTLTIQFTSDGSVVYAGFDLNITYTGPCFSTPCSGVPASNTIVGAPLNICPAMNSSLYLNTQYQVGGIEYQWYESTISNVGPFTPVSGTGTNNAYTTPTLNATTWYQAVITCTNSSQSFTTLSQEVNVAGQTTASVPYNEDFESVQINNMFPNCSWSAANLGNTVRTSTASQSNNRIANSGVKFAYFSLPSTNNSMYTNGIYMEPGITYSAGAMYSTEYFGYANWTDLSISVGPNQNATGQVLVASTAPAISGPYKALGGLFTVPTAGFYYLQIRANATTGSALYLMIDDVSVTIPCDPASGNSPTVTASASAYTVCSGDVVSLNATGADAYLWSTGATNASTSNSPGAPVTYSVVGTNTLTGCTDIQYLSVMVNTSPTVSAFTSMSEICPGQTAYLSAIGALSYAWSTGGNGPSIGVTPNTSATYSVIGTNQLGCSSTGVVSVTVKQAPTINVVNTSGSNISCAGENVSLNANGGVSYQWISNTSPVILAGANVNVVLTQSTTFTVTGTGANACSANASISQIVEICESIDELNGVGLGLTVYPNPGNGVYDLRRANGIIETVSVSDISGRIVRSYSPASNSTTIDIQDLGSGVYFLQVQSEEKTAVVKIVKN